MLQVSCSYLSVKCCIVLLFVLQFGLCSLACIVEESVAGVVFLPERKMLHNPSLYVAEGLVLPSVSELLVGLRKMLQGLCSYQRVKCCIVLLLVLQRA